MSGAPEPLLDAMARSSRARCEAARAVEGLDALIGRARDVPVVPLRDTDDFAVIAEIKLRAPSVGSLAAPDDRVGFVRRRAAAYAAGGAVAVSVLTEPDRFDGDLADLAVAAEVLGPHGVPAMRKDFLVDPYQVWEARAHGAGGVLLILRMLDDDALDACLDAAEAAGLFVLLEAFDAEDLERASRCVPGAGPPVWVGVNTRDLRTLDVDPDRLATLADRLPAGARGVAESGLQGPAAAAAVRALGYRAALVGSALMAEDDPTAALAALVAAGRR